MAREKRRNRKQFQYHLLQNGNPQHMPPPLLSLVRDSVDLKILQIIQEGGVRRLMLQLLKAMAS